jgi:hypothetical protein
MIGAEAAAQDTEMRNLLFREAEIARDHGEHARAVTLATRAAAMRSSPSLQLFLAQESIQLGEWLQAYRNARQCLGEVDLELDVQRRAALVVSCTELDAQISGRIAFLVVRIAAPPTGLRIMLADVDLPEASWGSRLPVALGSVRIAALAPDGRRFHGNLRFAPGQTLEVAVVLPPGGRGPPPPLTRSRVGAVVLGTSGLAALGLAGVFIGLRSSAQHDRNAADSLTPPNTPLALHHHETFKDYTTLAIVSAGVGAACITGGVIWYLLRGRGANANRAASVFPSLAMSREGLSLSFGGMW